MESAGIAHAAHPNRSLPMLSVRGISDQADTRKYIADAAGWQHIAAGRAAAFVVSIAALILRRQIPIIDTDPLRPPATSYKARHVRLSSVTDGQSDNARHARLA